MTDTDWSFSLRSATGFYGDASDDDGDESNVGDARTSSRFSSNSSQTLQQIDLAAREDSAQYKPNPWSIARINAASRPRQPKATIQPVSEKATAKNPPQGAIVDAFKKQAQKPKTTNSSTSANRRQTPSQKPALTSAIGAPDKSVTAPARSPVPIAHITTSAADPVPIPSQPRIPQQLKGTRLPHFLPRKTPPVSHHSSPTHQPRYPHFTPSLKRVQALSSPALPSPYPRRNVPSIPGPPPTPLQALTYLGPHTLEPHNLVSNNAHAVIDHVVSAAPADQGSLRFTHSSYPRHHHTPAKPETETISPHPRQGIQRVQSSPHLRPNLSTLAVSPRNELTPPPSSFAQARRFFEYPEPPRPVDERYSPEPLLLEKSQSTPSPSRFRTTSSPMERSDPYDQLPPSPDSQWSTLKPPAPKVNGKGKSKALDVKSGRFRLPLTLGTIAPNQLPQKKARVITYLPPPLPKKQRTVVEPRLGTRGVETGICTDGALPQRCFVRFTVRAPFSVKKSESSFERVALSTSLGRNRSAKLAHTFGTFRFEWCVRPLQNRPREDPSGTHV